MKSQLITRRRAIVAGLASVGGLMLPAWPKKLPPTYGNILRMGDTLTYAAHRTLLPGEALVKEYRHDDITSFPATGTTNPADVTKLPLSDTYRRFQGGNFADWRLSVEGRVASPRSFSLADLKRLPERTQITRHTCEEGWSAIGQWTGVPLSLVLNAAGILPTARFVVFHSFDDWVDSIDLLDALHPQTLLAYGMNGRDLPIPHGAPVRLRVERQLGYKSMKYLHRIVVTDEFEDGGDKGNIQHGWAWYVGI
ncbi:MAG TPA: molybdopterin-dependent oxidoreductase [Vicinamibacterales bacterium]|jgi:DMSO/TMAO reductase YedYZ molybdopterin-dependent catalytic subunit|nr:molybdopterin-dependent oxidoreductase [Vicinamibacterales bacterium]